jgi:hypothetical protein
MLLFLAHCAKERNPSGAKAQKFIASYRRHECLLHPVTLYIFDENL